MSHYSEDASLGEGCVSVCVCVVGGADSSLHVESQAQYRGQLLQARHCCRLEKPQRFLRVQIKCSSFDRLWLSR